jgi:uncharacterized protein (DUF983 family)
MAAADRAPFLRAALRCRCPRCGKGALFTGPLKLRESCPVCGLDLRQSDAGDATSVPVILVLGSIIVGLAFWVEFKFEPPFWVHVVVWPILTVPLAILLMRPVKAAMVALQYRNRSSEMEP